MPPIELRDRDAIAAVLRRNPRAHVYELGDLDDFDWPFTRWFGWEADGRLEHAVLLYAQPSVPVLIAIADEPNGPITALLETVRDELPRRVYVHVTAPLLEVLAQRYSVEKAEPHLKLALAHPDLLEAEAGDVEILGESDLADLGALYEAAYPGTWFEPRLLATGRYIGVRRDGRLVCVAGVHVYSPRWGVAGAPRARARPGRLRGAVPAPARGRDRDDRPQRPPRQCRGRPGLHEAGLRAGGRVHRGHTRRPALVDPQRWPK